MPVTTRQPRPGKAVPPLLEIVPVHIVQSQFFEESWSFPSSDLATGKCNWEHWLEIGEYLNGIQGVWGSSPPPAPPILTFVF